MEALTFKPILKTNPNLTMRPECSTKRKKKLQKNRDSLRELPRCVLLRIFSFVDMRDVVRTSILSTSWRYFWKSLPVINIDCQLYLFMDKEMDRRRGCDKFVDMVLNLRDSSSDIQRLRLSCFYPRSIDKWIRSALTQNVQELYLDGDLDDEIQIPECLFTCKSLTALELRSKRFLGVNLPDSMSLPRLKTLLLHWIRFKGEHIVKKIFSSCPVLESFTITRCIFNYQAIMDISSLQLKHLVIENCTDELDSSTWRGDCIKIYAPNLISFRCKDMVSTHYSIKSFPALVRAEIDIKIDKFSEYGDPLLDDDKVETYANSMMTFLRVVHNVEELKLSTWFLEVFSRVPALTESTPSLFCNLKCLKLHTSLSDDSVYALTFLLNFFPNIESIFLETNEGMFLQEMHGLLLMCDNGDEGRINSAKTRVHGEAAEFPLRYMLNNLKLVQIRGTKASPSEGRLLHILLTNSVVLEKVLLYTSESRPRKCRLKNFTEQLFNSPRASSNIAFLVL